MYGPQISHMVQDGPCMFRSIVSAGRLHVVLILQDPDRRQATYD